MSVILCRRPPAGRLVQNSCKSIWGYVAIAFNKVDADRLSKVGPDRLCAEWLIKNGGAVSLVEVPGKKLKDYNLLPPDSSRFHIQVVDATDSSIMKIGLDHFIGCKYIDTAIFHNCEHLEPDGLQGLIYLRNSLKRLQVSSCYNIRDEGLQVIGELQNLEQLRIFGMKYVSNLDHVIEDIRRKLPNVTVSTQR